MSGSITGQVLDQRNGQPIEGAACASMPEGGEAQTDGQGNFAFNGLAAGNNYELTVQKGGFEPGIYGPLVVLDDNPTQLVLSLQPQDI